MWHKKLHSLKKTIVSLEPNAQTRQQPDDENPFDNQESINFEQYCAQFNVTQLQQDQVVLNKSSLEQKRRPATSNPHSPSLTLIDEMIKDDSHFSGEFYRFGQRNLPKQLRSGKLKINHSLDLHQHTQAQALDALIELLQNTTSGTILRIIHGKGLNSPEQQPVLLKMVRNYLRHHPRVLAFSYGNPNQGGNGVTLVKIR